jgi:pimeloyl-ACP methyl ester carboxylesterase
MLINGHQLYVEWHGPQAGPPVLLLHHGLGSTRAWRAQAPALAAAGFRVLVYDRWGYGKSAPRPGPGLGQPDFAADRADLLALLDAAGWAQVSLVGHSDGGTIALYAAAEHPERVRALLVAAAHIYIEPRMVAAMAALVQQFQTDSRFRTGLQRVHGAQFETVFHHWHAGWQQTPAQDWDMRPQLAYITCRTLVTQGEADEHATPQHARDTAAAIPGAALWLVPQVGHMLPQDAPELFNARLIEFLQQG